MAPRTPTILIVEDEPIIADLYSSALRKLPYRIEQAHNKQSALTKIQQTEPHLILLDLLIPIGAGEELVTFDHPVGFDIIEWLRHHPTYQRAKIIVLTNLDADLHAKHARSLGVDDYLVKANLEPSVLAKRITTLLSQ